MTTPNKDIRLRDVSPDDLPIFFEQQLDPDANHMVAFTAEDPSDSAVFMARWDRIMNSPDKIARTILFQDEVAGHVTHFEQFGNPSVGYWLGREFWGKGIATQALRLFLDIVEMRPLYARVAQDNIGSIRVLQKCGFAIIGEDKGFAHSRGKETQEYILKLI